MWRRFIVWGLIGLVLVTLFCVIKGKSRSSRSSGGSGGPVIGSSGNLSETMRFQTFVLQDDPSGIGGEVSRMLIPAGWKTQGGMAYDFGSYFPAQVNLRIYDPNSPAAYQFYPASYFIWGDFLGVPPGTNDGGDIVAAPVTDPYEAIREFVIQRYRPELANATEVEQEPLPKFADASVALNPPMQGADSSAQAARLRLEYTENGKTVQEDFYAVLRIDTMQGISLWNVDQVVSVRGEKGTLDAVRALHEVTMRSVRGSLPWFNKYCQFMQVRHNAAMQFIASAGDFSRTIAQESDQASDDIRQAYENTQAVDDQIAEARSEAMRGEQAWDTGDGNKVLLPMDYEHAWQDGSGEYVITKDPSYDPNTDPNFNNQNWSSMQALQH